MSSIKFDPVLNRLPELRPASEALGQWLNGHDERTFIYPAFVLRDYAHSTSAQNLLRLLAQLVAEHQLEMKYRVVLPDGALSEDDWDDPKLVPPIVFDSAFQPVEATDDRIVTIYQLPSDHGR